MPLLNILIGDRAEGDDVGVGGVVGGGVGVIDVVAMDWRFANDAQCFMYLRFQQNWSKSSYVMLSQLDHCFPHDSAHSGWMFWWDQFPLFEAICHSNNGVRFHIGQFSYMCMTTDIFNAILFQSFGHILIFNDDISDVGESNFWGCLVIGVGIALGA
jgi:hypothetical protein